MPAYKDKERNTWYCSFYITKNGKRVIKKKRGFETRRSALEFERKYLEQHNGDLDNMTFESMWELYCEDMKVRLRENTMLTKTYIAKLKILPYFGNMKLTEIKATHIRNWQNELIKQGYKETYLKTISNQLSAFFNYCVKYHDLGSNPARKAGSIGKSRADEMQFYTISEFETFIKGVSDKPQSEMAFKVLFWTGMRIGELMALTYSDIDFENNIIHITKSYQRLNGKDVITPPKTPKSVRDITMPETLKNELYEYVGRLYGILPDQRIFQFTKHFLEKELVRSAKTTGVKRIRAHDMRHSHATMLIEMGVPILEVRDRLGHEKVETTLNTYGHLYPNKQEGIAQKLELRMCKSEDEVDG